MIEKLIGIAKNEVGYLEKKSNSQLDDKTANAGRNNYTKYARDLDNIPNFYNGRKNGYAWCDVFVDWCFVQAFGVDKAKELLCQPNKSLGAGCYYSANYYKQKGQFFSTPKKGDQIFFKNSKGDETHTGIVIDVDSKYVYTIEGNTSSARGVIVNGGCVREKSYSLNYRYISGYGRPKYNEEVIKEDFKVIYQTYDNKKKKWLNEIVSNEGTGIMAYAGNFGNEVGGIRIRTNDNSPFKIVSHIKNGKWLSEITKWDDTSNGYSGIKEKSIDGIAMKVNNHKISYRVHTINGKWYDWVNQYNINDWVYGVAGVKGKPIDAIEIRVD